MEFNFLEGTLEVVGHMESKWAMFSAAIAEMAVPICVGKAAGASCGYDPRTHWWTPEDKGMAISRPFCGSGSQRGKSTDVERVW